MSGNILEDKLAIEELLFRYGMALDSLDGSALRNCFMPDALTDEAFTSVIEYHRGYEHTMHNVHNRVYDVRGDQASGTAYCISNMVRRDGDRLMKFDIHFRYRDELAKLDGHWRFVTRKLELAFSSELSPVTPGAPLLGLAFEPSSFRA